MPKALSDLEHFLHHETRLPILIKVGLAHAQLETIHPFPDGNGRMGRLLITFLLCGGSILQKPVLYLSHDFKQYRTVSSDRGVVPRSSAIVTMFKAESYVGYNLAGPATW